MAITPSFCGLKGAGSWPLKPVKLAERAEKQTAELEDFVTANSVRASTTAGSVLAASSWKAWSLDRAETKHLATADLSATDVSWQC